MTGTVLRPHYPLARDQDAATCRRLARGRLRADVQRQERGAHPAPAPRGDRRRARADREALIDDRYDVGHVVSHAGAKMRAVTAETSDEVRRLAAGYDAVGIDEVQFFDEGITYAISALVGDGARVVAAGLAQDFRGLPFGAMPTLLCVAEFVDKLEAVCHHCGGSATMTQRLVDGAPAPFGGETIQVGALDSYEARCRACFEPGPHAGSARAAA
jgi:thymidine kinase